MGVEGLSIAAGGISLHERIEVLKMKDDDEMEEYDELDVGVIRCVNSKAHVGEITFDSGAAGSV